MNRRLTKLLPGPTANYLLLFCLLALSPALRAPAAPARRLSGHVPKAVQSLQPLSRLAPSNHLDLAIGLPLRNEAALNDLLQRLYDPADPDYRRFLSPEKFAEMFGPSEADYTAVIAFARANRLTVTGIHPNRLVLDVSGTVTDIEQAFGTKLNLYQHPKDNRVFFAPAVEPRIDPSV
ncbi:MAG TPA: protease pro-enzyme activation domain-containing protein, partial [Verrucomicrobiae bacterium]|nr:protease pro-enzyme activation domain-containing protein [Verrucomicrobiae bacterium]